MKRQYPSYYPWFRCIGPACRHTCCVGWEIDIDEATLARYQSLPQEEREPILSTICQEGDIPHFALMGEGEKCPHLNEKGLCSLICKYGEEMTPSICRDHPRYRHILSDGVEYGLGLTCEEACRIIVGNVLKVGIMTPRFEEPLILNEEEQELCDLRQRIVDILQDEKEPITARMQRISDEMGLFKEPLSLETILDWYDALEYQSETWHTALSTIREGVGETLFADSIFQKNIGNIAIYFIHRHLLDALDDGYVEERIAFALISTYMVVLLAAAIPQYSTEFDTLCEAARIYSTEVEYSTENTDILLEKLTEYLWN